MFIDENGELKKIYESKREVFIDENGKPIKNYVKKKTVKITKKNNDTHPAYN